MADSTHLAATPAEPNLADRLGGFLRQTRAELGKVTWPTRDELIKATRMVLILTVVLGLFIGLLDYVLQLILVDGVARLAR